MNRIYLDYAAATPVDQRVRDVMQPFFTEVFYNPSGLYQGAREARTGLENARARVAKTLGTRPSEIIFTAGATESVNLAIKGVAQQFPEHEILISSVEHDCVRKAAESSKHQEVPVDEAGVVRVPELSAMISDQTVLISIMYVNNEVGSIQPIREIATMVETVRKDRAKRGVTTPIWLHTDAAQAPNYLDVHISRLGVDMMTLNGGKMYGPKQSGILYMRAGIEIKPQIDGGGQEFGYRSGTENIAFAVGFAEALERAQRKHSAEKKKVSELRDKLAKELIDIGAELNGHKKHRIANNVHVTFPGIDNERVLFALDDAGVSIAAGSACSASSDTSSHVLLAMGKTDEEARSSLRITLGKHTTDTEISEFIHRLAPTLSA